MFGAVDLLQDAIEICRAYIFALGKAEVQRGKELRQRNEFFARGRIVDTVDERPVLRLRRFGGADIRLDHELLDELHGFEFLADADSANAALTVDIDLVFGEIEIERRAGFARPGENTVGGP